MWSSVQLSEEAWKLATRAVAGTQSQLHSPSPSNTFDSWIMLIYDLSTIIFIIFTGWQVAGTVLDLFYCWLLFNSLAMYISVYLFLWNVSKNGSELVIPTRLISLVWFYFHIPWLTVLINILLYGRSLRSWFPNVHSYHFVI